MAEGTSGGLAKSIMSMWLDTRPLPGDSDNNLLSKLLQVMGGSPTPADNENSLLVQILEQANGVGASVAANGGAISVAEAEDRFVDEAGDLMTGALRMERGVRTTDEPTFEIREYFNNPSILFSLLRFHVTQTAASSFSNFVEAYKDSDLIYRFRTNGTISSERHEGDQFENMFQGRKRGNAVAGKLASPLNTNGIMAYDSYSWNGSAFALVARIVSFATQDHGAGTMGTDFQLHCTPTGSGSSVERLRVGGARVSAMGVPFRLHGATVATLPASPLVGDTAYVTNALAPAFGAAVVGGGAVTIPVFFDGTTWIVA